MISDELLKKINVDFKNGNFRENFKDLIKIFKIKKSSDIANKIGVVLIKLNKKKFAKLFFEISIKENKNNYKPFYNLANLLQKTEPKLSEKYIDEALKIENHNDAKLIKSHLLIGNFKYDQAINILNEIDTAESNYLLGVSYLALGEDDKNKIYLEKSLTFKNIFIDFLNLNTFPRVYKKSKDIKYFRDKFLRILNQIFESEKINQLTNLEKASIIQSKTNFNLSYQQKNDLDLNKKYYLFLKKILGKNQQIILNKFTKKKILFLSGFFFKHTLSKLFFNFIDELSNKKNLDVNLLHLSNKKDEWTEMYQNLNINFYTKTNITNIEDFLKKEKFESIFFLDHSMNNIVPSIISKKFAKNYFIIWGHPITTGSKNMDYFISSELMDNDNQNQYSEKLILLDGIGFNYKIENKLRNTKIQKPKENTFYMPQGLFKFLPKYDPLIGEILDNNKNSTISFIKDKDPSYTNKFINRLKKNKKIRKNLDRLIFLDGSKIEFYNELVNHKVILDTIGWSGGNTSMEAIYLNKPIVTMKGYSLRANHTLAMLKQMHLDILIAEDYKQYIYTANKLIDNKEFFNSIVDKIISNKHLIFNEKISLYEKIKDLL